ncbi:MAG: hypothetical protein H6642_01750 [Caldilineaceae bacterium]|nr:hypothetical protein [Caldilineaceae bacterium]
MMNSTDVNGTLYAGGWFTAAGGMSASHIAKWDGTNWSALGSGMGGADVYGVKALATDTNGNLYAGGYFYTAGDVDVYHIAKWDGAGWTALGDGADGAVMALTTDMSGSLYAAGSFTTVDGVTANRIAKWDGISWAALGAGMNGAVSALAAHREVMVSAADQGRAVATTFILYAGGGFTTAGGNPSAYLGQWTDDTPSALLLGYFSADQSGDRVNLHWQTATETGLAGFLLYGETDGSITQLTAELIPSAAEDSHTTRDYSYQAVTDTTRFYLDEQSVDGGIVRHGPFELGQTYGAYAVPGDVELRFVLYVPFVAGN